jgi:histone acetyltransferase (RNA polymerase elongator complex component)
MTKAGKPLQSHYIIPIFVPHMGCPNHCVFCNQASITGTNPKTSPSFIARITHEISEKVALRCSTYVFDHAQVRSTANSKFAPRAQTSNVRTFRFTKNGYQKNLDSRSELLFPVLQGPLNYLRTQRHRPLRTEVAFYGGSFTGMEKEVQVQLLSAVQPLIRKGLIDSVRVSTRPDYVDSQTLDLLKEYGVLTVELGVQSMVEEVLQCSRRGHTAEDVLKAVKLLHEGGFEVGVQIMVGLPGDDAGATAQTVDRVIRLNPHFARIYPTLVLKGTLLEKWYRSGCYTPLSLEGAVDLCKRALLKFHRAGIPVIRLGLQSSPELETKGTIVAGPYHPALGHLVESSLFYDMTSLLLEKNRGAQTLRITVSPSDVSNIRGQKNRNVHELKRRFGLSELQIEVDEGQPRGSLIVMNGKRLDRISYQTLPFS